LQQLAKHEICDLERTPKIEQFGVPLGEKVAAVTKTFNFNRGSTL